MSYNVFPHFSSDEAPSSLNVWMGCLYAHILFKLLLQKSDAWQIKSVRIHLDVMREIYKMTVLNLKTARDKCPPSITESDNLTLRYEIWAD